jgi:hypothetical protein
MNKIFTIELNYLNGSTYTTKINTNNIEFSMDEYQRNSDPFDYTILSEQ